MNRIHLLAAAVLAVSALTSHAATVQSGMPLQFGAFVASGGTITIAPDGTRTAAGNAGAIGSSGYAPGSFSMLLAAEDPSFVLVLPESASLTGPGGATILIDTFRSTPESISATGVASTVRIDVGATLHLQTHTPPGNYTGVIQILITSE
jgi:hypothetical protein